MEYVSGFIFWKNLSIQKNKRIQMITHDWIPGNKFIVCCVNEMVLAKNQCVCVCGVWSM